MRLDARVLMMRGIALVLAWGVCTSSAWAQETVRYYTTDAVGSVRMVTDSGGAVIARYDYRPFGDPCGTACGSQGSTEKRQFAGMEKDAETSLDYVGARYYASQPGRFTSTDPVLDFEQTLGDPQRWNRYAYSFNNPLRYVDPDGRQAWLAWAQNILNSPSAQRISQVVSTQAANLTMATMRLLGHPATPELAQAMAELATGAELPGGLPATGAARLLPSEVAENFVGPVHRFVAQSDLTAYRFWTPGSASRELGQWLTTESTVGRIASPQDAIAALNLNPSGNLAKVLSKIQIQKGTEVFAGRVRRGSEWATQLWIRDRQGLRLLGQVDQYGLEQ